VSSVTKMEGMFYDAINFNQDLSSWCVSQITEEPTDFSAGSSLTPEHLPVWGSCPTTSISDSETEFPASFILRQNYPNPFNPSTLIEFGLPEASHVQLAVFDMTGRRVALLENGFRSAGWHQISFDAAGLASGLYIYRIQSGEFAETRKMMLVK